MCHQNSEGWPAWLREGICMSISLKEFEKEQRQPCASQLMCQRNDLECPRNSQCLGIPCNTSLMNIFLQNQHYKISFQKQEVL